MTPVSRPVLAREGEAIWISESASCDVTCLFLDAVHLRQAVTFLPPFHANTHCSGGPRLMCVCEMPAGEGPTHVCFTTWVPTHISAGDIVSHSVKPSSAVEVIPLRKPQNKGPLRPVQIPLCWWGWLALRSWRNVCVVLVRDGSSPANVEHGSDWQKKFEISPTRSGSIAPFLPMHGSDASPFPEVTHSKFDVNVHRVTSSTW